MLGIIKTHAEQAVITIPLRREENSYVHVINIPTINPVYILAAWIFHINLLVMSSILVCNNETKIYCPSVP